MIFVDVPKHRQFVCTKCGSRNVKVMPIFPAARGMPGYAAAGEHRLAVEDCAIDRPRAASRMRVKAAEYRALP
jgi:hypothetical protein